MPDYAVSSLAHLLRSADVRPVTWMLLYTRRCTRLCRVDGSVIRNTQAYGARLNREVPPERFLSDTRRLMESFISVSFF